MGYYSIQKGRIISFDKEPVIIRQEEHLFSGTIRENLCLGENFSEEDLKSAMEFANISDLDLNRFVSEDAGNLSGGQIQRISIARAKLHCTIYCCVMRLHQALTVLILKKLKVIL